MRVLIFGGRTYHNTAGAFAVLDRAHGVFHFTLVITGLAPDGADNIAERWADTRQIPKIGFRPPYKEWPPAIATALRNQRMIDDGRPDIAFGFQGAGGSADMFRRLADAGIPAYDIDSTGWNPRQ
jgi:hypothetical protein